MKLFFFSFDSTRSSFLIICFLRKAGEILRPYENQEIGLYKIKSHLTDSEFGKPVSHIIYVQLRNQQLFLRVKRLKSGVSLSLLLSRFLCLIRIAVINTNKSFVFEKKFY